MSDGVGRNFYWGVKGMKTGDRGRRDPASLGVPPSPQRAVGLARKQGRAQPGVLAPQAKRIPSSPSPGLLVTAY